MNLLYTCSGISLVDETPEEEKGESGGKKPSSEQQQQLAEGVTFAYDAPDKTNTEKEQVREE